MATIECNNCSYSCEPEDHKDPNDLRCPECGDNLTVFEVDALLIIERLTAANKNLGKQLQDVETALNSETAKRLTESAEVERLRNQYSKCQQFIGTQKVLTKELCDNLDALDA